MQSIKQSMLRLRKGVAKFGGKKPNKAAIKLPLRDGDIERDDEAYKGHSIIFGRCGCCAWFGKAEINRRERFDTREAITKDQMRKFLKFVHDDNVYCKYYEVFYILFHTGLRISEFCGLTIKDIDLKNRIINIDHQLQRIGSMEYHIESTKTNAGTRKLPMTEDVFRMFRAILEDRPTDFPEIMVDGYVGFLFRDKNGMPEVALHWEHRLKNAVNRYNSIFRVQLPKITPHICRHTYCSNQAKAGMNPKTLQYLMGHSDIGVTMNTYTHLSLDDAKNEMIRMEELEQARKEVDKAEDKKPMKQNMFKVV